MFFSGKMGLMGKREAFIMQYDFGTILYWIRIHHTWNKSSVKEPMSKSVRDSKTPVSNKKKQPLSTSSIASELIPIDFGKWQYVAEAVRQGRLGQPRFCDVHVRLGQLTGRRGYDWTCEDGMGGGVLTTVGSHVIDVVSAVTGQRAVRVHGISRSHGTAPSASVGIRRVTSDTFCRYPADQLVFSDVLNIAPPLPSTLRIGISITIVYRITPVLASYFHLPLVLHTVIVYSSIRRTKSFLIGRGSENELRRMG